jgi:hypothetical protein
MTTLKIHIDGNNLNYITENINLILTSFEECDFILSSKFNWGLYDDNLIQNNLNYYRNLPKNVIIFLISDTTSKFNIPYNVTLFRTSLYKTTQSNNEFLLPYVWEKIEKPFTILSKTEKPIIGFCGNVDQYRESLINTLQKNNNLQKNFLLRNQFWGGKPNDPILFEEFTNNILNSHFTICNRGRGNFSMRFYQTLSAGRIPILTDTDMVFPFEDEIDWDSIIIIGKNDNDVINKVLDWWINRDIEKIQIRCKEVYDNFCEKKIYFNKIFENIEKNIKSIKNIKNIKNDFDINIYSLYNDLQYLNNNDLINHYYTYGEKEKRLCKLPNNFNVNIYKKNNDDLKNFNNNDLIKHFINHGFNEGRIYYK